MATEAEPTHDEKIIELANYHFGNLPSGTKFIRTTERYRISIAPITSLNLPICPLPGSVTDAMPLKHIDMQLVFKVMPGRSLRALLGYDKENDTVYYNDTGATH